VKFSIIIPSYNQDNFIEETLLNVKAIKEEGTRRGIEIECLLFDSESNSKTQEILSRHKALFDVLEIKKDKGQYDAINKGIEKCSGDYWTWLNTDDLLDIAGFFKLADEVKKTQPDYIYGDVTIIDANGKEVKTGTSGMITLSGLVNKDPSISQQGSFFKTSFSKKIGLLEPYQFAFDYEYVLRVLKNGGKVHKVPYVVAKFRYYAASKSGSQTPVFLIEESRISKKYGRKILSRLSLMLNLRIIKRKIFN